MSSRSNPPTAEMFEPYVDNQFTLHLDEENFVKATLVEVSRLPPPTRRDLPIRKDPFSLVFKVVDDIELDQRQYLVEHATHGTTEMFLVPIGFGEYQGIFT